MSASHTHTSAHGGDGHHGHDDHGSHDSHGSLQSYATGFFLAVILTAIPFWLVLAKVFDKSSTTGLVLLAFGVVQIVVHMIYFLHMNSKLEGGWSMLALIFTILVVGIMMSGSSWVMYHLNHNMMPGLMTEAPTISESTTETMPESLLVKPAASAPAAPATPGKM